MTFLVSPPTASHALCVFHLQVRAVTGGYFVAILLVFLGSLVGLKLPGLFSGGEAGGKKGHGCAVATLQWHCMQAHTQPG